MSLLSQKTLKKTATFSGVGLHNGKLAKVLVKPSEPNTGIVFKRVDLQSNNYVYPSFTNVTNTLLNTTISNEYGVKVSTIEHLMGALFGLGIDNALVEINNEEIPILDGSANEFVEEIRKVGVKSQREKRKFIKVLNKIEVKDGEKYISIEPLDNDLIVDFEIIYDNPLIRKRRQEFKLSNSDLANIYCSRTFCLYEDIDFIKSQGLAKGGSLENALVVDQKKVLNKDGLRNNKEFVNHKILDLAGDFLLSGYRLVGKIRCYQGGHELTNLFLRKIFKKKSLIQVFELEDILVTKKIKSTTTTKLAVNA